MRLLLRFTTILLAVASIVPPIVCITAYDRTTTSFPLWSVLVIQALPVSAILLCAALLFAALERIIRLLEEEKKEKNFGPHI